MLKKQGFFFFLSRIAYKPHLKKRRVVSFQFSSYQGTSVVTVRSFAVLHSNPTEISSERGGNIVNANDRVFFFF